LRKFNPARGCADDPEVDVLLAEISSDNQAVFPSAPTARCSVARWALYIRPDFIRSGINEIEGIKKLIAAKDALKKRKGSFCQLVEKLGQDLDKVERLIKIASHPVLGDSAHARNLPLSWMTRFTLVKIPPDTLLGLIRDGTVHPELERKQAEQLVQKARGSNSNGSGTSSTENRHDDGDDRGDHHGSDRGNDRSDRDRGGDHGEQHEAGGGDGGGDHRPLGKDDREKPAETANAPVTQDSVGESSPSEIGRLNARIDELQNAKRQLEIKTEGLNSQIEELEAKLDETSVRHQRRLFRQALDAVQKAEASNIPAKEKTALHNGAIIDLTEFVRSAARDGLSLTRFDVYCRPEN
jgi:hypothetical protein